MSGWLAQHRVLATIFVGLLLVTAVYTVLHGDIGPLRPQPDATIFVNEESFPLSETPIQVDVPIDQTVAVRVEISYKDDIVQSGEFTYQWCFEPPVAQNRYCSIKNYKSPINWDYKAVNPTPQTLKINVSHPFFQSVTAHIEFNPYETR